MIPFRLRASYQKSTVNYHGFVSSKVELKIPSVLMLLQIGSLDPLLAHLSQQDSNGAQSVFLVTKKHSANVRTYIERLLATHQFAAVVGFLKETHARTSNERVLLVQELAFAIHQAANSTVLPLFGENIHNALVDIIADKAFCGCSREILACSLSEGEDEGVRLPYCPGYLTYAIS